MYLRGVSIVALAGIVVGGGAGPASAQAADTLPAVAIPPSNVVLPNYSTVPIGEIGGLEVGAFIARANDSSSAFYNPAGLTRAEKTSVSGSAGTYQWGAVSAEGIETPGGSFQHVPAMFGIALQGVTDRPRLSGGLSIARTVAWAHAIDFERVAQAGTAQDRVSYSADARMDSYLASLGVGYVGASKWRLGASVDGQWTSIERRQAMADQYRLPGALTAFSISSRNESSAGHLRFTAGTQYDLADTIILGAVFRTAGIGVYSSGFAMLEGLSAGAPGVATASYFDDQPEITFRVPSELKAGAAYVGGRAEFEVDVLVYAGAGRYESIASTKTIAVLTAPAGGTAAMTEFAPVPPVIDSRTVVNVAAGGHFDLTSSGAWVVHGGYGTDRSPAGDADTTFTRVHLQKITAGLSGRTSRILGSLGIQYLWGTSDPITLRQLPSGALSTRFKITNLGAVYSLAVLF
jgi:hypothetical protein